MLLIIVKPNVTLRFVSLNIWESLYIQVKTSSLPKILLCVIICLTFLTLFVITLSFEDFSDLANGTTDFRMKLQESLLIHRDGPQLNKTSESAPMMLFSYDIS